MPEALFLKEIDNKIFIRAVGHITAALCADLRELVLNRIDSFSVKPLVYVDLSSCSYMDSTFLGLLVGFNKRLQKNGLDRLSIVNPSTAARELLVELGLITMVDIVDSVADFPMHMDNILRTKSSNADLILKAHENLMELSEENRRKFGTLHSMLKNQVGNKTNSN